MTTNLPRAYPGVPPTPVDILLRQLRHTRGQLLLVADHVGVHCEANTVLPSIAGPVVLELEKAMHAIRNAEIQLAAAVPMAAEARQAAVELHEAMNRG